MITFSHPKPIGILGGTVDPVHYGHLRPALEMLEVLGLAEIRFIPCRLPYHRGQPVATPAQRLALLPQDQASKKESGKEKGASLCLDVRKV